MDKYIAGNKEAWESDLPMSIVGVSLCRLLSREESKGVSFGILTNSER